MTELSHTPAQSGRELSRARRRAMSSTGAAVLAGNATQRFPAAQQVVATATSDQPLSGQALSRARRAMMSKGGKNGLVAPAAAMARSSSLTTPDAMQSQRDSMATDQAEPCCNACADASSADSNTANMDTAETAITTEADIVNNEALDSLCKIIDSDPKSSTSAAPSVRAYCRERRTQLSQKGKLGLPGKAGRQAHKSLMRHAASSTMNGKALAKLQREGHSHFGRGDAEACRPSGRVRPTNVPTKVEVGTTLAGQAVTGTQVEQTEKITGSESGACRTVTGTEYLGVEQFAKFCASIPSPAAAKVNMSETSRGQRLTGSNASGSEKVSGDEAGSCKSVTGSQYLGSEHFETICGTRNNETTLTKVISGHTGKNQRITGADEARDNAVTGSESGFNQLVTGTEYANSQPKKNLTEAPAKVGHSHTAAGTSVSGGESSRISGVTGDMQNVCGHVTGTEYISSERFQSVCGSRPEMSVTKVEMNLSRGGMGVTGNLVDRTENVTGNEPGSCQRVTGSQYAESLTDLCGKRSDKVHRMHTLQGGPLTGTEGSPSPKLTGDDRGRCSAVTGSEYVSQEHFQQSCSQTPASSVARTGMSHTWNKQLVSGVQTGHSQKLTGNEHGICKTVTGSAYAGREQVSEFCDASAVMQGEQRLTQPPGARVMPVSGIGPGADERLAGNSQRGVCQDVSGTPYQQQRDMSLCNSRQPQTGNTHHFAQAPMDQILPVAHAAAEVTPYEADFSVMSPAKAAWQQAGNNAVHSSVYAVGGSITGVVNKAEGIISGTPEFRHQQLGPAVIAMAAPEIAPREGVTGEGSETGTQITGDDWSRGGLITGTEGLFSANRNQTQRGGFVERNNIGAHALKDRERPEISISKVTGGSGNTHASAVVTLSGGAGA